MAFDAVEPAPALPKALQARHVMMISIGGIIGSGLFVGSSAAIAAIGPAVIVSYALAGLLVLFVMRSLGELAISAPDAGSFTEYIRIGAGEVAGFVAGWLYWYFWVIALAIEALAGGSIIRLWIDAPVWAIALALMILLSGINLLSTRSFGEAEFWLSLIKVVALVAFILFGCTYLARESAQGLSPLVTLTGHGGFAPHGIGAVLVGVATVIFALVGAEIVTVAAAESQEPARAIARLTTTLVLRLSLFFVASMAVVVAIVPWTEIQPGSSPFGLALGRIGIPGVAQIMNVIVVVAVLSCLNAGFYVSSRVLFGLARRGDAPQWMVRLNRRGTPVRAILSGTAIACIAVIFAALFPEGIFTFLVNSSGIVMLLLYALVVVAQLRHRRRLEAEGTELRFRSWGGPWSGYATIAAIAAILVLVALEPSTRAQLSSGFLLVIVTSAIAWLRRRGARARSAALLDAPI